MGDLEDPDSSRRRIAQGRVMGGRGLFSVSIYR